MARRRAEELEEWDYGNLRNKLQELKKRISEMESSMEEKIEENPLQAVAIAFGIGVLAGITTVSMLKRK